MIRRLRIKFVCINMVIVTGMLLAVFATVLYFTRADLAAESLRAMRQAAVEPPGLSRPGEAPLPCFTLRLGPRGELLASGGGYYDLSDEALLREILDAALSAGTPEGVLEGYGLRFCLSGPPERRTAAFADMAGEKRTMERLVQSCLLIGSASFLGFLAVSLLLARWAAGPVERAWQQQRRFVADASHELKTPLSVILTNAELLESRTGENRCAANILTMARQMRTLVEHLLELARVDEGLAAGPMERLDLSGLVCDALLPFEPVFFEAGLGLESRVEPGLEVRGSGERLHRAVDILLDNAQKYAAPGGLVRLSLERTGRSCLLRVSNPGEPLSGETLQNIFKRFYRADPARGRDGGFGLGLAIAEGIVEAHRGKIWAESAGGVNTFCIRLPLAGKPGEGQAGETGGRATAFEIKRKEYQEDAVDSRQRQSAFSGY